MPGHPFSDGVTVMVEVIVAVVVLVAVNAGTSPVPLAASPIAVLLFVQVYAAPAGLLVKLVPLTASLWHTEMFAGTVTVGVGLTVMV